MDYSFAYLIIVCWNLFILFVALWLKKVGDNFVDSHGGDSRIKEKNIFSSFFQLVSEIIRDLKHYEKTAKSIRQKRGEE